MCNSFKQLNLSLSFRDFSILHFALDEALRVDTRLAQAFPDEDGSSERVESLQRLIHILDTSGDWIDACD